jgi:hypothetical protein
VKKKRRRRVKSDIEILVENVLQDRKHIKRKVTPMKLESCRVYGGKKRPVALSS